MSQSRNDCDRDVRPWSSSRVDTPRYSAGRMSQKKVTMQSCTTCLLRLPSVSWSRRSRESGRARSMSNITGCALCCGSSSCCSNGRYFELITSCGVGYYSLHIVILLRTVLPWTKCITKSRLPLWPFCY